MFPAGPLLASLLSAFFSTLARFRGTPLSFAPEVFRPAISGSNRDGLMKRECLLVGPHGGT